MDKKIRLLTFSAISAALVFTATWVFKLPIPGTSGYVNLGDAIIYLSAWLLGPAAEVAAAIGSALADLAGGYTVYLPATFIIKGLMGLVFGLIGRKRTFGAYAAASILCGAIMTAGYAVYEAAVFDIAYALTSIPYNLAQWGGNVVAALILYPAAVRLHKLTGLE
jgi:uncharacterized membrane protein